MELLRFDRAGRPQSAAEVMERLAAISGVPIDEHVAVSRAYLTMPVLVGRERALVAARKRLLSLVRGDGGSLLVEGVPGSGRSRLLDAAVFEAKLLGVTVLRADMSDAASGEWGVARALGAQLLGLLPEKAEVAARISKDLLGHVIEGFRTQITASTAVPERSVIIRELRDFVLALAQAQRLVIAVDDVDRIDEPSAALLAALAHKAERYPLLLALTADSETRSADSISLGLLRSAAATITSEHLSPEQSEALIRSLFGDVPNLPFCAGRIHTMAQGNPRATLELAQHLVDRGLARYAAGSWALPARLDEGDLPSSLAASLARRLSELSADAQELAGALALADGDALMLADYAMLTSHGDGARVFHALDELVAARVLAADADHYCFSQRGFLAVLADALSDDARTAIHARIAERLADTGGNVYRRTHHLLGARREAEAVELLAGTNLFKNWPPLPLVEAVTAHAERLGESARTIHTLRTAVLSKAAMVLEVQSFNRCYPAVLSRLERDSGLALYRELESEPPANRLTLALTGTQERYMAAAEHERVHTVLDAIRELARLSGAFCTLAMSTFDVDLLDSLPSLEPLRPLSPAISVIEQIVESGKDYISARGLRSQRGYQQVLARISEPDRAGLEETHHQRTRVGVHFVLGLIQACMGASAAEQHATVLAEDRELRINAWRLRVIMHLTQGDTEQARKCLRRAELIQLQQSGDQRYPGTTTASELIAYALAGDLQGVKNALDVLSGMAKQHPGWRATLWYAQCCVRRLQGDAQAALDLAATALGQIVPGRQAFWPYLAAMRIDLLSELGRHDEAVAEGRRYLEICEREQVETLHQSVHVAMAQALARAGEHAAAVRMIDEVIAVAEKLGVEGLALGVRYEARARIALAMEDRAAFDHFAACCANEYGKSKNPILTAKFMRLIEHGMQNRPLGTPLPAHLIDVVAVPSTGGEYETVQSRMLECVDRSDRARCALTLLLQSSESLGGYLYGLDDAGGPDLLSAVPDIPPDEGLCAWIAASVQAELDVQMGPTLTGEGDDATVDVAPRYTDPTGRAFEPVWLVAADSEGELRIAGVLALQVMTGPRTVPPRSLLSQIARQLLEHRDVHGALMGA
jgi:tetratricopeptide (TPR) repeat protein